MESNIDYPYMGKYGILTKPFARSDQFVFDGIDKVPLSKKEIMLAESMMNMMNNKNIQKKYSNGLERAKDFDVKNITKRVDKLLGI